MLGLAFILYLGVLVYFGFIVRRDNWLGWFMFCRASYCYARLRFGSEPLNIWDHIDHTQVIVHRAHLEKLLWYLRYKKGIYPVDGDVELHTASGVLRFKVKRDWLV